MFAPQLWLFNSLIFTTILANLFAFLTWYLLINYKGRHLFINVEEIHL